MRTHVGKPPTVRVARQDPVVTLRDLALRDLGEAPQLISDRAAMYWGAEVQNMSGRVSYVQVFDAASPADVTVGVTAPVIESRAQPGAWNYRQGHATHFERGIVIAVCTTGWHEPPIGSWMDHTKPGDGPRVQIESPAGVHVRAYVETRDGG